MSAPWEVEQKFVVTDEVDLRTQLAHQGYQQTGSEQHCDIYFRHPCRDLRANDEAFRLRTVNAECCLTYKGPRMSGPIKMRPEIELDIQAEQHASWLLMLKNLGFEPLPMVRKRRHNFAAYGPASKDRPQVLVSLDEVERLGTYAELELIVDDVNQLPSAGTRISQLAAQLGLVTVQPQSYLSLVLELAGES